MEPTPYTFTPSQWHVLQDLTGVSGADIPDVITEALRALQQQKQPGDRPLVRSQPKTRPPLASAEERKTLWKRAQEAWQQDTHECIREIEESRREWDEGSPSQSF